MRELKGKTAFVTGGAGGIGFALGRALAEAGMKVMLADIETDALAAAVNSLHNVGPDVRGVACDVADPISVEQAAKAAFEAFGNIHVICNNAGVAASGGIDNISLESWRWVLDVNLMGVLHGIRTFLPYMRAHGEGGHIVNTASMAGMLGGLGFSAYTASKFAVVGMSEGLAMQLRPLGIGVTILCPGYVRTRIGESGRNRPERYGATQTPDPASPSGLMLAQIAALLQAGSTRRRSQRAFSPRSARTNSMCSRIRKCAASWSSGLPPSRRRWTGRSRVRAFSSESLPPHLKRGGTGSRWENASKQKTRASVLIQSEPKLWFLRLPRRRIEGKSTA